MIKKPAFYFLFLFLGLIVLTSNYLPSRFTIDKTQKTFLADHIRNVTIACKFSSTNGCLIFSMVTDTSKNKGNYAVLYYTHFPWNKVKTILASQKNIPKLDNQDFSKKQLLYINQLRHSERFGISPNIIMALLFQKSQLSPLFLQNDPTYADDLSLAFRVIINSARLNSLYVQEQKSKNPQTLILGKSTVNITREVDAQSRALIRYLYYFVAKDYDDFLNLTHNFTPDYTYGFGKTSRSFAATGTELFGANFMTPTDYKRAIVVQEDQ